MLAQFRARATVYRVGEKNLMKAGCSVSTGKLLKSLLSQVSDSQSPDSLFSSNGKEIIPNAMFNFQTQTTDSSDVPDTVRQQGPLIREP